MFDMLQFAQAKFDRIDENEATDDRTVFFSKETCLVGFTQKESERFFRRKLI